MQAQGHELLLGLRNNRPAQRWCFTPRGRIRKNEPLEQAVIRVALDELGMPAALLQYARRPGV